LAEKYRKQPKLQYEPLLITDIISTPDSELNKLLNRFFNFRTMASVLCGIIAVQF